VTDTALPSRIAEICQARDIQVIEAMPASHEVEDAEPEPHSSVG
jgi:hypothetical protein